VRIQGRGISPTPTAERGPSICLYNRRTYMATPRVQNQELLRVSEPDFQPRLDHFAPSSDEQRPERRFPELELAERVAFWMDKRYLDPILGFVLPGAGDAIGAVIGLLTIFSAIRMRAHPIIIARMFLNLAFDSVLGSIPLLGAVLDLFYRAHTRNLKLLQTRDLRATRPSDWVVVGGAVLAFILALCLPIVLVIAAISWFW
jgi:Domain of unknown function (DUF4112)